jgi:hypothetical protein
MVSWVELLVKPLAEDTEGRGEVTGQEADLNSPVGGRLNE